MCQPYDECQRTVSSCSCHHACAQKEKVDLVFARLDIVAYFVDILEKRGIGLNEVDLALRVEFSEFGGELRALLLVATY